MPDRYRAAITLATALALGASAYGHAFDLNLPGVLQDIWNESDWAIYVLTILGVFLVYRWWALLPALAPLAVTVYLYKLTDYETPWRQESVTSSQPFVYVLLLVAAILLQAAILSLGLLLRAAFEWVRSERTGRSFSRSG